MKRSLSTWGMLGGNVVALVAAVTLSGALWVARRELDETRGTLIRGQGESLLALARTDLRLAEGPPTPARLAEELERLASTGATYLAFGTREALVEAGTSVVAAEPGEGERPLSLALGGARARIAERLPPRPMGEPGPPGARPPPPEAPPPLGGPPRGPWRRPPSLVVEYEPRVAVRLTEAIHRTVAAGAAAIVLLLASAVALSLWAARRRAAERGAEQQRRLAALGEMSGVMAHELRNPLASLKGNAQLLEESLPAGSREHDKAALVVREAERLERLTNDLLAFVRDGEVARLAIATDALVERAARDLPPERRAQLAVDLSRAPRQLLGDEARLALALGNLLDNAVQATGEPRPVRVRIIADGATRADAADGADGAVGAVGRGVVIEVDDEGPGLPPGEEERIFEPFVTTRVRGTGLGLAVARRAVEQHGGTLTGETRPEGGARFRITLPASAIA